MLPGRPPGNRRAKERGRNFPYHENRKHGAGVPLRLPWLVLPWPFFEFFSYHPPVFNDIIWYGGIQAWIEHYERRNNETYSICIFLLVGIYILRTVGTGAAGGIFRYSYFGRRTIR